MSFWLEVFCFLDEYSEDLSIVTYFSFFLLLGDYDSYNVLSLFILRVFDFIGECNGELIK